MTTHTVYRYYDAEDRLLYVGYTYQFRTRDQNHRSSSPWFAHVDRVEREDFADMNAALDREHELILAMSPRFNRRINRTNRHAEQRGIQTRASSFKLTENTRRLLAAIAEKQGVTMTAALEVLIRKEAKEQGIKRG